MASEESSKKNSSKTLPGLIFLIGVALILGGVLMQIGYFDTSGGNPAPEETTEATEDETTTQENQSTESESTESSVDFSITTLEDNIAIPVKKDVNYTYGTDFTMTVTELDVKCEGTDCGKTGSQVTLTYKAGGNDYPITLTDSQPTVNLIDVPVTVKEWHENYVVIEMQRS